MSVLSECLDEYKIEKPSFQYIDSINFSSKVCSGCGNSLTERCAYFHIETNNHHNALADALMCAKLVIASVHSSRYNNFFTYIKIFNSIKVHEFQAIRAQKFLNSQLHPKKSSPAKTPTETTVLKNTLLNTKNPLYEKICVFTGELDSLSRNDATQAVLGYGGIVKNSVAKATNYLIVGTQDSNLVGPDGISTKEKRAYELLLQGINIKILDEKQFLALIAECKKCNDELMGFFDVAQEGHYISLLKGSLEKELSYPSDPFICSLVKNIYDGATPPAVIDRLRELTINAIDRYVSGLRDGITVKACSFVSGADVIGQGDVFPDGELETVYFITSLIGSNDVNYDRTERYVYLYPSDSPNKWICRIYFNQEPHLLVLHKFNHTGYETEYLFNEKEQLGQIKDILIDTYQKCKDM